MTMIVEIVNPKPHTWYANKKGWQYEVEEGNFAEVPCYRVVETSQHLWSLYLPATAVKVIEKIEDR